MARGKTDDPQEQSQSNSALRIEALSVREFGGAEHIGEAKSLRAGSVQEDVVIEGKAMHGVCDGMGGGGNGDLAAKLVSAHMINAEESIRDAATPEGAALKMQEALFEANELLQKQTEARPELESMGTTVNLSVVREDGTVIVGHIGDSVCYSLDPDGRITKVTKDHSLLNELIEKGHVPFATRRQICMMAMQAGRDDLADKLHETEKILPEDHDAYHTVFGNIINNVVSADPFYAGKPDITILRPKRGSRLIHISDGVSDYVKEDRIAELVKDAPDMATAAQRLIDEANKNHTHDNVSAVVVRL